MTFNIDFKPVVELMKKARCLVENEKVDEIRLWLFTFAADNADFIIVSVKPDGRAVHFLAKWYTPSKTEEGCIIAMPGKGTVGIPLQFTKKERYIFLDEERIEDCVKDVTWHSTQYVLNQKYSINNSPSVCRVDDLIHLPAE